MSENLLSAESRNKIRINKYLSEAGFCSRREADRLILEGRVCAEDHEVRAGEKIFPEERVYVDGKPILKESKKVLLLFYKPRDIVCSTRSQGDEITVTRYLDYPLRVYPVGRLDKDSEGLLLLTNRGELVNQILRGRYFHEKEYCVTVDREIDREFILKMSQGVPILDTVTRPCVVRQTGKREFRIILTQGLNRQIRRMCEYFGCHVVKLKRIRIMNFTLKGLEAGQYREATVEEMRKLEETIGLERGRK